jgi:hypothetical protein
MYRHQPDQQKAFRIGRKDNDDARVDGRWLLLCWGYHVVSTISAKGLTFNMHSYLYIDFHMTSLLPFNGMPVRTVIPVLKLFTPSLASPKFDPSLQTNDELRMVANQPTADTPPHIAERQLGPITEHTEGRIAVASRMGHLT